MGVWVLLGELLLVGVPGEGFTLEFGVVGAVDSDSGGDVRSHNGGGLWLRL